MLRYNFPCAKHCSRHLICDNYEVGIILIPLATVPWKWGNYGSNPSDLTPDPGLFSTPP